ncbi:MAG: DUF3105 domain-containing protein [Solirubrobacteraceae bacterium]
MRFVWFERVAIVVASLVLSVALIALLSGYFAGHDPAGITGSLSPIGERFADLGHAHLRPGELRPEYDSIPPTSGAHVPAPVLRDAAPIRDDQLLQALETGDVVIFYGGRRPPSGLAELARQITAPFTPALAAAGQAVIIASRPGTVGLIGVAWTRMVRVSAPGDPLLRQFAQTWLGHGAPGR